MCVAKVKVTLQLVEIGCMTRLFDTFATCCIGILNQHEGVVKKEAAMMYFYFAALEGVVLVLLLSMLQVHAHIAAALLPW